MLSKKTIKASPLLLPQQSRGLADSEVKGIARKALLAGEVRGQHFTPRRHVVAHVPYFLLVGPADGQALVVGQVEGLPLGTGLLAAAPRRVQLILRRNTPSAPSRRVHPRAGAGDAAFPLPRGPRGTANRLWAGRSALPPGEVVGRVFAGVALISLGVEVLAVLVDWQAGVVAFELSIAAGEVVSL